MTDETLTVKQAYLAMYSFLENYYTVTKSDEIGGLLGSMSLLSDGVTADPAISQEWQEAVAKVKEDRVDAMLSFK
ncbi:MAG: hypothetical protein AB8G18_17280 [Gammaproteobacteria bacterium]